MYLLWPVLESTKFGIPCVLGTLYLYFCNSQFAFETRGAVLGTSAASKRTYRSIEVSGSSSGTLLDVRIKREELADSLFLIWAGLCIRIGRCCWCCLLLTVAIGARLTERILGGYGHLHMSFLAK